MTPDNGLKEALKDCEFPVIEVAKLLDSLMGEFRGLDPTDPRSDDRARHLNDAFTAISQLARAYSGLIKARGAGSKFVN